MNGTQVLPTGTLLLEPTNGILTAKVWTVASPRTIVRCEGGVCIKATLTKPGVPRDWQLIDNRALARHLSGLAGHDIAFPTGRIVFDVD